LINRPLAGHHKRTPSPALPEKLTSDRRTHARIGSPMRSGVAHDESGD